MAIKSIDELVAAMPGQILPIMKNPTVVSGQPVTVWTLSGYPSPGVAPLGGINGMVPNAYTPGAPQFFGAPGRHTYLGRLSLNISSSSVMILYDRLWANSVTLSSTSVQSIAMPHLTRPDALGEDVELWWQTYATMSAGTPTVTVTYTNSEGVSGRTASIVLPASAAVNRVTPFALSGLDTGVRSVQSVQLSASVTGTAGLVLRRKIATIGIPVASVTTVLDGFQLGMPRVYDDACLEFIVIGSGAGGTTMSGEINLVQG